ncbi:hypothetical protein PHAVU_010G077600 [Phaseolus vulgaris]|uniref:Uncharacterized protein n=1 Tax=Phaseolus vulgaris TaxID=3885 RepID=V7ARF0_PHAVU|nr:hypothetical protein PHAVU_010G077600g [Phaseolus vulgaris]ESW06796.1 hypothetical protein PHAVU_010G077600g [Phaseolus vulgaris]
MPKPKRIKNLLKAIGGHSSDTFVGNYVQLNDTPQTTPQQITESGQPHFGSPLPQASGHTTPQISQSTQPRDLQPTFESTVLPQTESTQPPISQSSQPEGTSDSAQPHTSNLQNHIPPQSAQPHALESEVEMVPPKKGRQSNYYWFVDTIGKDMLILMLCFSFSFNYFHCIYLNVLYFIDEHGVTQKMKLKLRDAHNLPTGIHVVVNYDDNFQPIGEACGLLAGWAIFVDYRLKPSTVKLCNRNREIRKKQAIPHTSGAMALSRRRDNLMWKITRKRKNDTYVNDEAMEIGDEIDELMFENPDTASHISPNDLVGVIFGKEHPRRVRGLAFRKSTTRVSNMNNGFSSAPDVASGAPSPNQNIRSSGGSKIN